MVNKAETPEEEGIVRAIFRKAKSHPDMIQAANIRLDCIRKNSVKQEDLQSITDLVFRAYDISKLIPVKYEPSGKGGKTTLSSKKFPLKITIRGPIKNACGDALLEELVHAVSCYFPYRVGDYHKGFKKSCMRILKENLTRMDQPKE